MVDAAELDVAFSNSDVVLSLFSPFSPARTTIKARTSGVLLVAGVGSFFAYRVASNLLGNRFVWECLEARRIDQIPTADRRLLYSFNEIDEEDEEEERKRREDQIVKCENNDDAKSVRSISQVSLSRLNRVRRSTRQSKGLLGSLNEGTKNAGIVSRQSSRSIRSGQSNCSIPFSCASSTKSASLRIVWEGSQPAWDDFDMAGPSSSTAPNEQNPQSAVVCRLGHVASTSSLRRDDMASVGDLCSVFNDVMSVTSMADGNDMLLDGEEADDCNDGDIWQKCMMDSTKYMYQSFAVGPSEGGSEDGGGSPSRKNFLDFLNEAKSGGSTMLSPLDSEDTDNFMTSSHNSRSNGRSMYDSAIGGEISSEDGSSFHEKPNRLYALQEGDNMSGIAPSCASLEWCDDISRDHKIGIGFDEKSSPLRLRRANLEWDMESEMARTSSVASSGIREVNATHAPKVSRDLMVMACEMFQPYSPPFQDVQQLYHKRRLKRVGLFSPSESILSLFIRSSLYHKCSLLRDVSWSCLEKRFDAALNECDFMGKWPGYDVKMMRMDLKELHELASDPSSMEINDSHCRALEILMVLEAKRAYDERLAGLFCDDWFDVDSPADVMKMMTNGGCNNVPQKMLWNLICRVSSVSIELIDARQLSQRTTHTRFSSSSSLATPTLTWIRLGEQSVPLFYIPDEE